MYRGTINEIACCSFTVDFSRSGLYWPYCNEAVTYLHLKVAEMFGGVISFLCGGAWPYTNGECTSLASFALVHAGLCVFTASLYINRIAVMSTYAISSVDT